MEDKDAKEHAKAKHEHLKEQKEHKEHAGKESRASKKSNLMVWFIAFAAVLILFNQWQLAQVSAVAYSGGSSAVKSASAHKSTKVQSFSENTDLSSVDVNQIQSTAQAINALFPIDQIKTSEDAIAIMIPTGTPEYSEALGGITFDDPVASMTYLAKWYYTLSKEVKETDPETWQRYLTLAATPKGIACEFCCGVGSQGITADGKLRCGCQHNPALQALTIGLMKYTDMTDAEVLKEDMKWKSVFFPKNMVGLAMQMAGGDTSALEAIPGMVGGC